MGNYSFISLALVYLFLLSLSLFFSLLPWEGLSLAMEGCSAPEAASPAARGGWHLGSSSSWCRLHGKMFFLSGRSALFDKFQQPCFWCDSWGKQVSKLYWCGDLAGASCWYELYLSFRVCDTCWNNAEKSKIGKGSFSILSFPSEALVLGLCPQLCHGNTPHKRCCVSLRAQCYLQCGISVSMSPHSASLAFWRTWQGKYNL